MDKKAKERVAIAQDALSWIEAGALIPSKGIYCRYETASLFTDENVGKQLRDVVLGKCQVCIKGALFLAKAVRFDEVVVPAWHGALNDMISGDGGPLSKHFDPEQLSLIEAAFEGWLPCKEYFQNYPDTQDRLVAILKNIIRNEGTFYPESDL